MNKPDKVIAPLPIYTATDFDRNRAQRALLGEARAIGPTPPIRPKVKTLAKQRGRR